MSCGVLFLLYTVGKPFCLADVDGGPMLDENSLGDQTVPNLSSPNNNSPGGQNGLMDRYSRKVFVGGLPPDIDEGLF